VIATFNSKLAVVRNFQFYCNLRVVELVIYITLVTLCSHSKLIHVLTDFCHYRLKIIYIETALHHNIKIGNMRLEI
jgi:hypothetical protein